MHSQAPDPLTKNLHVGATAVYFAAAEPDMVSTSAQHSKTTDLQSLRQRLAHQLERAHGLWLHESPMGLCAVFPDHRGALQVLTRLRRSQGASAASPWRIGMDTLNPDATSTSADVTHLHALACLGDDAHPTIGARLRDRLLEPIDGELQDLGPCHVKHAVTALRAYRLRPHASPSAQPLMPTGQPSVTLLPPTAASEQPGLQSFGALLVDRVGAQLARSRHLRLISPLSSRVFAHRNTPVTEAANWLGARYVLSGRYKVLGSRHQGTLALVLRLADTASGALVWEDRFRASVGDVLSSDSQLVHDVSTGVHHAVLNAHMDWARQQSIRTLDDYTLLLSGIGLMHRSAPDEFDVSRQALLALLERAPDMGLAHAWLAKWHVLRVTRALTPQPQQEADVAEAHAAQAAQSPDAHGLACAMQGFVRLHLRRDLSGALSDLHRCAHAHPNEAMAWLFRGVADAFANQPKSALQASQQALALSPLDPLLYYFESLAASSAIVAGDFALAERWCRQSLRRNVMHLHTHRALVTALWASNQPQAAREAATQLMRLAPFYTVAQFERSASSAGTWLGQLMRDALAGAGIPSD